MNSRNINTRNDPRHFHYQARNPTQQQLQPRFHPRSAGVLLPQRQSIDNCRPPAQLPYNRFQNPGLDFPQRHMIRNASHQQGNRERFTQYHNSNIGHNVIRPTPPTFQSLPFQNRNTGITHSPVFETPRLNPSVSQPIPGNFRPTNQALPPSFMPGHRPSEVRFNNMPPFSYQKVMRPSRPPMPPRPIFSPVDQVPNLGELSPILPYNNATENHSDQVKNAVHKWLKSKNFDNRKVNDSNSLMKICEYQEMINKYINKLDQLRNFNDILVQKIETEKDEWDQLQKTIEETKTEVAQMHETLFNETQIEHISKLVKLRKKKRNADRLKRKRKLEESIASLPEKLKWNESIDEWLNKKKTKHLMEKIDENLKNEAGESLIEVKRKQSEANELIATFAKLSQLRTLRKKTAIYKGILVTEKDDTKFNSKVEDINNLLREQTKIYESEERALRILREEEVEEISRKEKERRKKRKSFQQENLNRVDPLLLFRSYWLRGEENIHEFIHIRQLWDMYLCQPESENSSSIPTGLIKPCELKKEWRIALRKFESEKD